MGAVHGHDDESYKPLQLAAGGQDGLYAWGNNTYDQLGIGSSSSSCSDPTIVPVQGISRVACGWFHTLVVTEDGAMLAWGSNRSGQLGDGASSEGTRGDRGSDGIAGVQTSEQQQSTLAHHPRIFFGHVLEVTAGDRHSLAITDRGALLAWGHNGRGQLGDGTKQDRPCPMLILEGGVTGVAAGSTHSLAVLCSGEVLAWGENASGQLGDGTQEQRSLPTGVFGLEEPVRKVAAGFAHSLAITEKGQLFAWGDSRHGQLGIGQASGHQLKPRLVMAKGVVSAAAGKGHSLASTSDGKLYSWGENSLGQLGDGTATTRPLPVEILGKGVKEVGAGRAHSLAITARGELLAWGDNEDGQLGLRAPSPMPVAVLLHGVVAAAAGWSHTMALLAFHSPH
mmetsp:Transcript_10051/g.22191  ORF Transcript_10051/g.22191 Transcript_10051/m.22191 type:complete len:395 (-) Transcript_10051:28-1212(-)|eukprot:CAMPEP_0206438450 /NCGR_PEP_ID=MMETSP0324_2-20121206/11637_1 /ASSEMBLY_ACC=CAM_ASM_000836 /TAXON_ID=2866 /ORGANISM="Crypthecodinium cohnii, Strain Seligo" /LENGTH=394 /DNA_ID=CAMNT_0053905911 /DNA_START=220 /DNA_END=1404 /DNA_ORIENTATION=-